MVFSASCRSVRVTPWVDLLDCRACLERAFLWDSDSSSRTGVRYDLRLSGPVVAVVAVVVEPVFMVGMTAADSFSFSLSALSSDQYLLVRLVEPVRVEAEVEKVEEEEPRLESRLRWPVGEVTEEEAAVVVVVEEEEEEEGAVVEVVEEPRSSCLLPKEPLR